MKQQFWKRPWFLISMSIFLIIVLFGILLFKDIDPVEPPEHLRYVYPEVSDEDNIYVDLMVALADLKLLKDEFYEAGYNFELQNDDEKGFLLNLDQNPPESLNRLRSAIFNKRLYQSAELNSVGHTLEELSYLRFFVQCESALMKLYAKKADWIQVDRKIRLQSNLISKSTQMNTLIEALVQRAIRGIYCSAVHEILDDKNTPDATFWLILEKFSSHSSWSEIGKQSFVAELHYFQLIAQTFRQHATIKSSFGSEYWWMSLMRPNTFYERAINYIDFYVSSMDHPRNSWPLPTPMEILEDKKGDYLHLLMNREDILLLITLPALDTAEIKINQLSWLENFIRLRAACLLYHRKNGDLPETLSNLVPDYLDEVPLDIYSGVEVQFNKEKSIFYVVGPDLKDDLGVKGFDKQTTPKYEGDIVQYIFPLENEDEENVSSIQE